MWTIGHISLGYLFSRPGFGKRPLRPVVLLTIFFFGLVPDALHHGIFWAISHTLYFQIPYIIVILWVLNKLEIIYRHELLPLFIAGFTHVLGDLLFGSFWFYFPFNLRRAGLFGWGSYLDLSVEVCLFMFMMIILIVKGDLRNLKVVVKQKAQETRAQQFLQDFALLILILAIMGQIGGITYLDFYKGYNFYNQMVYNDGSMPVISLLFMLVQIIFLYILLDWSFKRLKNSETRRSGKDYK